MIDLERDSFGKFISSKAANGVGKNIVEEVAVPRVPARDRRVAESDNRRVLERENSVEDGVGSIIDNDIDIHEDEENVIRISARRTASTPPPPTRKSIRHGRRESQQAATMTDNTQRLAHWHKGPVTVAPERAATYIGNNDVLRLLRAMKDQLCQNNTKMQEMQQELQGLKTDLLLASNKNTQGIQETKQGIQDAKQELQEAKSGIERTAQGLEVLQRDVHSIQGSLESSLPQQQGPPSRGISLSSLPSGDWPTPGAVTDIQSGTSKTSSAPLSLATQLLLQDAPRSIQLNVTRVKKDLSNTEKTLEKLNKALHAYNDTENCAILAVRRQEARLVLTFQDEAQKAYAKQHPRWLEVELPGARIQDETWFPIKLDFVSKGDVLVRGSHSDFQSDLFTRIEASNPMAGVQYKVKKAVWLGKPNVKFTGSMLVWLSRKEAASHFTERGSMSIGHLAVVATRYVPTPYPQRCFNCNKYGHRQDRCSNKVACGVCAEEHQTRDCSNHDHPKCSACLGPHQVTDRTCRIFINLKKSMEESTSPQECR